MIKKKQVFAKIHHGLCHKYVFGFCVSLEKQFIILLLLLLLFYVYHIKQFILTSTREIDVLIYSERRNFEYKIVLHKIIIIQFNRFICFFTFNERIDSPEIIHRRVGKKISQPHKLGCGEEFSENERNSTEKMHFLITFLKRRAFRGTLW